MLHKFIIPSLIFFALNVTYSLFGCSSAIVDEFHEDYEIVSISDSLTGTNGFSKHSNRIIVGGDFDYPPYEFLDKNGQPTGFNVELTYAIAEEMGMNVVIELKPWAQTRQALLNKEIDIVQGMFYSTVRDRTFELSQPHSLVSHVFVTRTGFTMPNNLNDLWNKKVVVMRGDIMHDLLIQNGFDEQIILAETQQQALEWLAEGKYAYALIAKIPALYWIRWNNWDNLVVDNNPIVNPDYCYASLEGNNLVFQFSDGLKILKEKGKYREIYNKWLGVYEATSLTLEQRIKYVVNFAVPLLLLLIIIMIWSQTLKKKVAEKTKELLNEIDERKKTERKFRLLADSTNDWEYWIGENNKYVFISPSCKKITGYPEEELYENPDLFIDMVREDYKDEVFKHYHDSNKRQPRYTSEFPIINKNKDEIWIEHSCIAIYDDEGRFLGRRGNNRDITARKIAEIALLKAKEEANSNLQQIKIIQANTPNIIWKWDIDNKIKFKNSYISEAADKFLALPKGSIGNSMTKFFSYILPEYLPLVENAIKNAIENTNKLISIEYEVKRADGRLAWFSSTGKITLESNKLAIYGTTVDITEKKQNEQKLLQSDRVFNLTLDMFCIAGFDGYFKYLNPAWERILGWSTEELLSKPWLEFVYPDDIEKTKKVKTVIVDGKEVYKFENRYICKNGSIKWFSWNSQPFPEENIMIGAVRDITETKRVENELLQAKERAEENEEQYKLIAENASDVVWIIDFETNKLKYVSPSIKLQRGYTQEEVMNQNFHDYLTPDSLEYLSSKIPKRIERFKQGIREYFNDELEQFSSDGSRIWTEVKAKYVKNKKTGKVEIVGVTRDISEQKKYQNELIKAKEQAEEADHLKSAFLANMSHEIRTPMNGILGFTELLQDADLSIENQKQYINIISESGERLLNTVNDIVEISKIESGEIEVTTSDLNVIKHLNRIATFFKPEAEKKNIDIVVKNNISENDFVIQTDINKLDSILTNLIKNAIKYTDEGRITIELGLTNGQLLFTFKDTGIGIPKNRLEAIFNRFEQADIADKRAFQGSGLGLTITKSYVEMLDGKIWVESEEGQGSTFYVMLPYINEKQKEQLAIHEEELSGSRIKNINVLIVEDDQASLQYLSAILNGKVKNILTAQNGIESLDVLKNTTDIDLILMDVQMPLMGGYEATQLIRQFNKEIIIIAQTAYALDGDQEKALDAGCNDYISKPVKKDKMEELINKYF